MSKERTRELYKKEYVFVDNKQILKEISLFQATRGVS